MKAKIKKLLFEYTKNSRITTQELGKRIGTSQQSASYLLNSLKKKKLIEKPATMVDAVKFSFVSVIVGFNLLNTEYSTKKEVIEELKEVDSIISIEEAKEGIDFLVEYIAPNLSSFNKTHNELVYKFYKKLRTIFVFPTIVNHNYNKKYLSRKLDDSDKILFGDRVLREINERESRILQELIKHPEKKLIDIAESTSLPVKSVVNIKRSLEQRNIIKGYTATLNHQKLEINRQIIFLRFSSEGVKKIDSFSEFTKYNKNIIEFSKIIGEYQLMIIVESQKEIEIMKDMRANFPIENYLIIKSEKIHKKTYLPIAQE
jgi:DNA-binding Lrp family transcriptional regulator